MLNRSLRIQSHSSPYELSESQFKYLLSPVKEKGNYGKWIGDNVLHQMHSLWYKFKTGENPTNLALAQILFKDTVVAINFKTLEKNQNLNKKIVNCLKELQKHVSKPTSGKMDDGYILADKIAAELAVKNYVHFNFNSESVEEVLGYIQRTTKNERNPQKKRDIIKVVLAQLSSPVLGIVKISLVAQNDLKVDDELAKLLNDNKKYMNDSTYGEVYRKSFEKTEAKFPDSRDLKDIKLLFNFFEKLSNRYDRSKTQEENVENIGATIEESIQSLAPQEKNRMAIQIFNKLKENPAFSLSIPDLDNILIQLSVKNIHIEPDADKFVATLNRAIANSQQSEKKLQIIQNSLHSRKGLNHNLMSRIKINLASEGIPISLDEARGLADKLVEFVVRANKDELNNDDKLLFYYSEFKKIKDIAESSKDDQLIKCLDDIIIELAYKKISFIGEADLEAVGEKVFARLLDKTVRIDIGEKLVEVLHDREPRNEQLIKKLTQQLVLQGSAFAPGIKKLDEYTISNMDSFKKNYDQVKKALARGYQEIFDGEYFKDFFNAEDVNRKDRKFIIEFTTPNEGVKQKIAFDGVGTDVPRKTILNVNNRTIYLPPSGQADALMPLFRQLAIRLKNGKSGDLLEEDVVFANHVLKLIAQVALARPSNINDLYFKQKSLYDENPPTSSFVDIQIRPESDEIMICTEHQDQISRADSESTHPTLYFKKGAYFMLSRKVLNEAIKALENPNDLKKEIDWSGAEVGHFISPPFNTREEAIAYRPEGIPKPSYIHIGVHRVES